MACIEDRPLPDNALSFAKKQMMVRARNRDFFTPDAEWEGSMGNHQQPSTTPMKHFILATLIFASLLCSVTLGQTASSDTSTKGAHEIQLTGTLEQRMAIGGETTGWSLRYGEKKRVEVLLPAEAFAWVKDGVVVSVSGVYGTKHFLERGDVSVFIVKKISQVVK